MPRIHPQFDCVAGLWTPPPGARVRLAFGSVPSEMRAVMWVQVSKDGSIYLGPRNPQYSYMKMGTKRMEGGELTVKYDEGEPILDQRALKEKKMSFHASGTIHAGGQRSFRKTFRGIDERELLCHILPRTPRSSRS